MRSSGCSRRLTGWCASTWAAVRGTTPACWPTKAPTLLPWMSPNHSSPRPLAMTAVGSAIWSVTAPPTMAGWINAVLGAGLVIQAIAEPHADEATAATHPQVVGTRIAPHFLIAR